MNKLETNEIKQPQERSRKSQQINREYKEKPHGSLELKKILTEIKSSMDGVDSRM